ncbi:MAG: hypothetical protein WCP89_02190 [archaeon]
MRKGGVLLGLFVFAICFFLFMNLSTVLVPVSGAGFIDNIIPYPTPGCGNIDVKEVVLDSYTNFDDPQNKIGLSTLDPLLCRVNFNRVTDPSSVKVLYVIKTPFGTRDKTQTSLQQDSVFGPWRDELTIPAEWTQVGKNVSCSVMVYYNNEPCWSASKTVKIPSCPPDTTCTRGWEEGKVGEGADVWTNTPMKSCDLYEVCNPDLDKYVNGAEKYCFDWNSKEKLSKYKFKSYKDCLAKSIISSFSGIGWMEGFFSQELSCIGDVAYCSDADNNKCTCANNKFKTSSQFDNIFSSCTPSLNNRVTWKTDKSDWKQVNDCAFSDLPVHATLNYLKTGTCVDYSVALTTLLRKAGFKKNQVYSVSSFSKMDFRLKYTVTNGIVVFEDTLIVGWTNGRDRSIREFDCNKLSDDKSKWAAVCKILRDPPGGTVKELRSFGHTFNLVEMPGESLYRIVDTTANKPNPFIVPSVSLTDRDWVALSRGQVSSNYYCSFVSARGIKYGLQNDLGVSSQIPIWGDVNGCQ